MPGIQEPAEDLDGGAVNMPIARQPAVEFDVNDRTGVPFVGKGGGVVDADVVAAAAAADTFRDRFWPKSVLSFLFLALVLTLASVQYVTPTRRWRPSLPGPVRRLIRRRSAS